MSPPDTSTAPSSAPQKSLDRKLAEIRARPQGRTFILADAKDADMAYGVRAPGPRWWLSARGARPAQFSPEVWTREEFGYRNLPEFLDIIREIVHQGVVDIMLMSPYVNDLLTIQEGLFRRSPVTPAARANDTSDIWAVRHGCYTAEPSRPFRTATIDQLQCGRVECDRTGGEFPGANLGLYSVTFLNDLERDRETLLAYKVFREEAERKQFRHFLEVFDPNVDAGLAPDKLAEFINDQILRTLAGVPMAGRPLFLKIVYHGPRALEELVQYDPNLVVGILGGSAGTTYDAFLLLHEAQRHGARVALYGRKINHAEHQLAFIEMLRLITEGRIGPEEAVRAYHAILEAQGIRPRRSLQEDMQITDPALRADRTGRKSPAVSVRNNPLAQQPASAVAAGPPAARSTGHRPCPTTGSASPNFAQMTPEQRRDYHLERLRRRFG
jgi:hypothetical protein